MKIIKNIIEKLLILVLINLIAILILSCNIKNLLVDGILKETVIQEMFPRNVGEENTVITEETINQITDDERIREILNSKEMQGLINKYLDITVNNLIEEDSSINEVELEKDILKYLKDNKKVLEEIVGKEITDQMIEDAVKEVEAQDKSKAFKQTIQNERQNLSTTERQVLKGYKTLISNTFKIIILCLILLDLLLIALIQKSFFKWIKSLGISLTISGIGIIIMSLVTKIIISKAVNMNSINTTSLLYPGIITMIIGIFIVFVYKIVENIIKKKEESYEIS